MKKMILPALTIIALLTACTSSLYKESVQDAQDATQANQRSYELSLTTDAGAGVRAFNKVAYCLTTAILRNEKQTIPDAGISCPTGTVGGDQ